tara:strand:- start:191 stop:427 length:237 start_codon:yes stop_codon:yes gene_type:complete
MNTAKLDKRRIGNCLFCRVKMLKKDFHYCDECDMCEMCEECAISHKKGHQLEKDYSIAIMENVICGINVKDKGNHTFF